MREEGIRSVRDMVLGLGRLADRTPASMFFGKFEGMFSPGIHQPAAYRLYVTLAHGYFPSIGIGRPGTGGVAWLEVVTDSWSDPVGSRLHDLRAKYSSGASFRASLHRQALRHMRSLDDQSKRYPYNLRLAALLEETTTFSTILLACVRDPDERVPLPTDVGDYFDVVLAVDIHGVPVAESCRGVVDAPALNEAWRPRNASCGGRHR